MWGGGKLIDWYRVTCYVLIKKEKTYKSAGKASESSEPLRSRFTLPKKRNKIKHDQTTKIRNGNVFPRSTRSSGLANKVKHRPHKTKCWVAFADILVGIIFETVSGRSDGAERRWGGRVRATDGVPAAEMPVLTLWQQTCVPLCPLGKPKNSTAPLTIGWPGSPGKPTSPWTA